MPSSLPKATARPEHMLREIVSPLTALALAVETVAGSLVLLVVGWSFLRLKGTRWAVLVPGTLVALGLPFLVFWTAVATLPPLAIGCGFEIVAPPWLGVAGRVLVFAPLVSLVPLITGSLAGARPLIRTSGMLVLLLALALLASGSACSAAYASGWTVRISSTACL
ncbi:MAG: hypothetical protein HY689_12200 [Chloroflexi bacterium]|nr:hypothetical protein [Chloroflexota bacterium]